MTVSDLNKAIQNIDDKYLDIADAPEMEINQMSTRKNEKKILTILLAACLVMGLGIIAYAYGGQVIGHIFGWGNNLEVTTLLDENGLEISEAILYTENLTEPVNIRNNKMYFVVNGENLDITELVSAEKAFRYEYTDEENITHLWLVGLLEEDNLEHYGYAEYLKNEQGDWLGGYSARINTEPDGHTNAQWLEIAKELNEIPW